ncbi:Uncharacterised protein [Acinetobacter baumannii]|nr:Uncharacterised protein [Acinetobacter baumannii]
MFHEKMIQIDLMFRMSVEGLIDEKIAENFISANIEELDSELEEFKGYIKQREDMR